jgi:RNA polymerase sigma-70 factor (ECF subfamily)
MSESRLLEAFKENERDLLNFLIARLRSAFVAQDLVQELYVRIRNLDGADDVRNDRAYLFRMASNLAIDHLRREHRRSELQLEAQQLLAGDGNVGDPERSLIAREELARLEQAVSELPPVSRRIFHLSRFEEKSQREIAEIVGLSPTAVFNHLRRVIDHLAKVRDE